MPVWSVSEPYISLWLHDEPMGYQPAIGSRVSLNLAFKQREVTAGVTNHLFSFGKGWNCGWFSQVTRDAQDRNLVHLVSGAETAFNANSPATDYHSQTLLTGATNTGFTLTYSDGSKTVYGFIVTNNTGVFERAMMTETWNSIGQITRFNYESYTPETNSVIRLKEVIDGDGRTNTITYVTNNAFSTNLIARVTDPFGRFAEMQYDHLGRLTNLTDVANLSTSFVYDANDWVTNMTTPYGPTTFAYTDSTGTNVAPSGRSVLITEPDGSKQLYFAKDYAPGIAASYATNEFPVTAPFTNFIENVNLDIRNSFHWNKRQYEALSTTNISTLTTNDFRKGRMQHWLFGETLSMTRESSPDAGGAIEGQKTWFDYEGKVKASYRGTQSSPLFVAQVLPDGSTSFVRTERNDLGYVTREISTYSATNGVALRTNTFSYAANLIDLLRVTNALGIQVSSNAYNSYHQVTTNFNALNEKTVFTYDASNRLSRVISPTGLVTTNIYGTNGFVSEMRVTGISTNSFTYSNNLVFTATDERGLTTTNYYDALQRLVKVAFPDGTFVTNTWDKLDLVRVVDRMGFTNSFGYDALRRNTTITNALGHYTLLDYCGCGSLNSVRDAAGNCTYFFYDNAGRQTNTVFADGYSVTNRYNLLGQLTNTIDSAGTSVTNWFNNQGLMVAVSNAFGRVSAATLDVLNRATNTVDANGVTITNAFDNASRLLVRGYPDGGVERWGYTANFAGATSYTNQLGSNVVNYFYDSLNRKTNEVTVGISTNTFTYSGASDLLTLTDGKNQTTSWGYDIFGRQTSKTNANGLEIERFAFDPNGRATNRWTAAKGNTAYIFDAAGNVLTINYPLSPSINFSYDSLNRVTNRTDAVGTNVFTYNAANQLLTEDAPWASDTISYAYQNRLRSSMSLSQPSGTWTNGYLYDVANRLTNITSQAGSFGYRYAPANSYLLSSISLPGGSYITNTYDGMTHLLNTSLKTSGGVERNSHAYGYDLASRRTVLTNTAGDYRNYTYDNIGQLRTAFGFEASGASRLNEQHGYAYDPAGNLNHRTNNALVQIFTVDALNQLSTINRSGTLTVAGNTTTAATNVTVNSLTATRYTDKTWAKDGFPLVNGTTNFTAIAANNLGVKDTNIITANLAETNSFAYDLNGNLRTNGTEILEYDDENRLVTNYVAEAWKSEFVYDGANKRRIQRDYSWTGSAWTKTNETRLVYDGNTIIQHRDANNVPTLTLTRGLDLSGSLQGAGGIGGLLARTETINNQPSTAYYHGDAGGNVVAMVNGSGTVVARYSYDPFGNVLGQEGPLAGANRYRFSSKEWHAASGLIYYGFRHYSPNLQRWTTQDPIGEEGGINLFAFVDNDPVNWFDSDGLSKQSRGGGNIRPLPQTSGSGPGGRFTREDIQREQQRQRNLSQFERFAQARARERHLEQQFPGHKPGMTYLVPNPAAPRSQQPTAIPCKPTGIVYLRRNPLTGIYYVGRANDPNLYIRRQNSHDYRYNLRHEYTVLGNYAPGQSLRFAEETFIRSLGGPASQGGTLQNQRYEMNPGLYNSLGGNVSRPTQ